MKLKQREHKHWLFIDVPVYTVKTESKLDSKLLHDKWEINELLILLTIIHPLPPDIKDYS